MLESLLESSFHFIRYNWIGRPGRGVLDKVGVEPLSRFDKRGIRAWIGRIKFV